MDTASAATGSLATTEAQIANAEVVAIWEPDGRGSAASRGTRLFL